jgi:hypothetical protein
MVMIEINDDTEDSIVCASLKKSYEYLNNERFYKGMFSLEPYENIVQVHLLRDAFKRVYEYYSTDKLE